MCIAAAAIPAVSLAISAVGTAASVGMGIMSAQMQAAQAQAQLNFQAQAQRRQMEMTRQQMIMNQRQQHQQMVLSQDQQYRQLELSQRQNQQAHNLQVAQANAQMLNNHNSQRQQVLNERQAIMAKHAGDRLNYQRTYEQAQSQIRNNNEAANRVYVAEQTKIQEAKKKAAFEQQSILAKSIGNAGNILAAGRTGQSVGLLLNDVERQKGFAIAQEDAAFASTVDAGTIAMEGGFLQAKSANNQAISGIAFNPEMPYLPGLPQNPAFVDGIGTAFNISGVTPSTNKQRF